MDLHAADREIGGDLVAGLASGEVRVVDLTQPLSERTPVLMLPEPFANTPGLSRRELSRYDDRGPAWAWDTLEIGEHVGTHFDAGPHGWTLRTAGSAARVNDPPSSAAEPTEATVRNSRRPILPQPVQCAAHRFRCMMISLG